VKRSDFSIDSIWNRRVKLVQSRTGYRFSLDAVLLAHFVHLDSDEEALEIGSGNGVIIVLLSHITKFRRIVGVELQRELAELGRQNLELNKITNSEIIHADMRDLSAHLTDQKFDLIFSNPPYRKAGTGKLNPNPQKAIARHELKMTLEDLFDCALRYLKKDGRLSLIFPDFRKSEFDLLVAEKGFYRVEQRLAYSYAGESPVFVLCTVSPSPVKFYEQPPLVIYDAPGEYSLEVRQMLTE
jgi:tRNA1Val (adenine37-N6)-methyltransferase